jgi:hypothetical protein
MRKLLIVLFSISRLISYGDAAPKFSDVIDIKIFNSRSILSEADSICALVDSNRLAKLHFTTTEYWTGATLQKKNGYYAIHTPRYVSYFKIIVFIGSERFETENIHRYPGDNLYCFETDNGKLTDISPFFHEYWHNYFISLVITLIVEVLIGLIFFFKFKVKQTLQKFILTFILVNIITHFLLWYVYSNFDIYLIYLEIAVVLVESIYWKVFFRISYIKAFLISLLTNFASWLAGGIVLLLQMLS